MRRAVYDDQTTQTVIPVRITVLRIVARQSETTATTPSTESGRRLRPFTHLSPAPIANPRPPHS